MEKYYHFTKYENLESILNKGLIPQVGDRSKSIGEQRVAVFLSKGIIPTLLMQYCLFINYTTYTNEQTVQIINNMYDIATKKLKANGEHFNSTKEEQGYNLILMWKNLCDAFAKYKTFKEYIGEGVFLCVEGIDKIKEDPSYGGAPDSWIEETIPPEKIRVVLLRDKTTGELKDSMDDIRNYFIAITPLEEFLNTALPLYDKRDDLSNWWTMYYKENDEILQDYKDKYELIEIPIEEYYEYMNSFHI